MDGGRLRGEVPAFIGRCFPRLTELDLSHNELRRVPCHTGPRTTASAW